MKTDLNKWLAETVSEVEFPNIGLVHQDTRMHLTCSDGTTLSVQASNSHYCTPRVNQRDLDGRKYTHIEVWCVSAAVPDSWLEYGDTENNPFAYIPIEMVEDFIDLHGGIKKSGV